MKGYYVYLADPGAQASRGGSHGVSVYLADPGTEASRGGSRQGGSHGVAEGVWCIPGGSRCAGQRGWIQPGWRRPPRQTARPRLLWRGSSGTAPFPGGPSPARPTPPTALPAPAPKQDIMFIFMSKANFRVINPDVAFWGLKYQLGSAI